MISIQSLPTGLVHQQLYISPGVPRSAPVSQPQTGFKPAVKRPRSPSPQPVPVSNYHQSFVYKTPSLGNAAYQNSPQKDDGRRHELVRAVLWNKTPQYASQPGPFYTVPPQDISVFYPLPIPSREPTRNVYEPPRPQAYHLEQKMPEHYTLRTPASHPHVIHGATIPISPAQPPSKTGSITAGYPVRSQTQYQQQTPASLYTAQSRPLYQASGTPMNYPPRD